MVLFIHSESKSLPFIFWVSGFVTRPINKIDSGKRKKHTLGISGEKSQQLVFLNVLTNHLVFVLYKTNKEYLTAELSLLSKIHNYVIINHFLVIYEVN